MPHEPTILVSRETGEIVPAQTAYEAKWAFRSRRPPYQGM